MLLEEIKNRYREEGDVFYPFNRDGFILPMDLKLDEMCQYKLNNHKPWLWFRNGYVNEEFLPLTISEVPIIPCPYKLNIKESDLNMLKEFVSSHVDFLMNIANSGDGVNKFLNEYAQHINESSFSPKMWILMPRETGLPTRIYIDIEAYTKGGHYRRIKIQPELGNNNSRTWPYITIPDLQTGYEMGKNEKRISSKILNPTKLFISNHLQEFSDLFDGFLTFEKFKKSICGLNDENDMDYDRYLFQTSFANFDWCIALDKVTNKYNIFDTKKHEFIFNEWFGYITRFSGFSPYIEGYLNGIPYKINCKDKAYKKMV